MKDEGFVPRSVHYPHACISMIFCILPLTADARAITGRFVGGTYSAPPTSRAAEWRTDNPVRLPERTSPRPAFGWIHGLTDRIVRPPRFISALHRSPFIFLTQVTRIAVSSSASFGKGES